MSAILKGLGHAAAAVTLLLVLPVMAVASEFNPQREIPTPDPGAAVLGAEDARFAAMIGANAVELGLWLADDHQYVHSTGQVANRQQFIDSIAGGDFHYLRIAPVERQVVMLGDQSALVRGHGRFQLVVKGNELDLDLRYLAVYSLGEVGRWRLRSWQSLRLPQ